MLNKYNAKKCNHYIVNINFTNLRKFFIFIIFLVLLNNYPIFANGERDTSPPSLKPNFSENNETILEKKEAENNAGRKLSEPLFVGNGGKGVIVAVPAPIIRNGTIADNWMPQFIQDLITGDLARFSAMTVLDRVNEQLAIAEQQLSESGFYSDENFTAIGNMTNAEYLVAGNIQNISGSYMITFRINNIVTNEVQTAFSQRYSLQDIENGKAVKEAVWELLYGMGIELTPTGKQLLLDEQGTQPQVQATRNLAHGMVAEKSENIIEALAFLSGAIDFEETKTEANRHIQNFFIDAPTSGIRERANYALTQKTKWEKIFSELKIYIREHLPVFIYDFSLIEDTFDVRSKEVTIYVSPGIKVIPNQTVLFVYKTILDNWFRIRAMEENKEWARAIHLPGGSLSTMPNSYNLSFTYFISIGLFDDYGDRIASFRLYGSPLRLNYNYLADNETRINSSFQVLAQHKYYDEKKFEKILCRTPVDKITDTITPRIERVYLSYTDNRRDTQLNYPVFTIESWQEWLILQKGTKD
jgi:hypothetical protein